MMVVAAIAGPFDGTVEVELVPDETPSVMATCGSLAQVGYPGVRLKAFTSHFNDPQAMDEWAYVSICSDDLSPAFNGIAAQLSVLMPPLSECFPKPLEGCAQGPGGTIHDTAENIVLSAVEGEGLDMKLGSPV